MNEPDRFDAILEDWDRRFNHPASNRSTFDRADLLAYLRAAESSALERLAAEIAQVKNGNIQAGPNRKTHVGLIHGIEIAEAVVHRHVLAARRALIPPAAAPEREGK